MYSTGCRIGEMVLLDKESVSLENRSAIVKGKGDKERGSILIFVVKFG